MMKQKNKRLFCLIIILVIAAIAVPVLAHGNGDESSPEFQGPPQPPQFEGIEPPPSPPSFEQYLEQLKGKAVELEREVDIEEAEFIDDPETLDAIWEKFAPTIELPEGAVLRNRVVVKSRSRTVCAYNFEHFVNGYRVHGDIFRVRIRIDTEPPQRLPVVEYPVLGVEVDSVEKRQELAKPMIWREVTAPEVPAWELEKPTPDAEAVLANVDAPYRRFESPVNLKPCWFASRDNVGIILDIETHELIGYWSTPPQVK